MIIKNRGLASVGINTELHPTEIPISGFTDGLNIRYDAGAVVTRFADTQVMLGNDYDTYGAPLNLIEQEGVWYYGTQDKLWSYGTNAIHEDQSRFSGESAGTYNIGTYWEFDTFGNTVIATNASNTPQIKTDEISGAPESANFVDMPLWGVENVDNDPTATPISWATDVIRPYGGFLIAIGMQEAANPPIHVGGSYPQRVRWSSTAQPGQAPYSWNGATLQTNAGWNDLSGITGNLIDGALYQDSMILFTEKEVVQMSFIGGNAIFSFRKLFDDGGMLARNCAVEYDGYQFVIGTNDVYIHDTSSKRSIANNQVKQKLFAEIGATNTENVRCFHNELDEEIWVMYSELPEGGGEFPLTKAAVWNYQTEVWSFFSLNNASGIAQGVRPNSDTSGSSTWDDAETINVEWDDTTLPWNGGQSGFGNTGTVYSSYDGNFYLADGSEVSNTNYPTRFIERIGIDLSAVSGGDIERWVQLDKIIPVLSGGTVRVTISGSKDQHTAPDWDAASNEVVMFTPGESNKIDVRQSWSYLAIRVEFLEGVPYELHALDFQIKERGMR